MKLRISGTRAECAATVAAVSAVLAVREVSDFYPNRTVPQEFRRPGASQELGRVYVDARHRTCPWCADHPQPWRCGHGEEAPPPDSQ